MTQQKSQQRSPIYQYLPQNEYSPFRKHLPIIPQSQVSQQMKLAFQNIDGVIESVQYLGQSFQSRLYQQGEMKSSLMSQSGDSGGMSPKQKRVLMNKIYQKQKQLVLLQNKLYMIKNTNECLRDTLSEQKAQKNNLIQQVELMRKQNDQYKQKIIKLQQQITTLQLQLTAVKQSQEEQYFKQNNIMSKSRQQLIGQNESLQQSIRQMTEMYEREIGLMMEKHQQVKNKIEQKWVKITQEKDALLVQKEILLKIRQKSLLQKQAQIQDKQLMMQTQREQLTQTIKQLQQKLDKVSQEKKQLLQQYLEVIQEMKQQMQEYTNINNFTLTNNLCEKAQLSSQKLLPQPLPITCENIIIHQQGSYEQQQQIENQGQNTNNVQSLKQKKLQINRKISSQKINNFNSNQHNNSYSYDFQLLSKNNSISSLMQPVRDMNTSYIAERLNQTMIAQYPSRFSHINYQYFVNNLNKRSASKNSRSNSRQRNNFRMTDGDEYRSKSKITDQSPSKFFFKPNTYNKPSMECIPINPPRNSTFYSTQNNFHFNNKHIFNQKLYKQIDNKLDQIKYQINKEIAY